MRTGRTAWLGLGIALVLAACGSDNPRTEQELQNEFNAFTAARGECAADSECVLATAECPLGCFAAVRSEFKSAVEQKARELAEEYRAGCSCMCMYDCASAVPACRDGRCAAVTQ